MTWEALNLFPLLRLEVDGGERYHACKDSGYPHLQAKYQLPTQLQTVTLCCGGKTQNWV